MYVIIVIILCSRIVCGRPRAATQRRPDSDAGANSESDALLVLGGGSSLLWFHRSNRVARLAVQRYRFSSHCLHEELELHAVDYRLECAAEVQVGLFVAGHLSH